uniref:DNA helicase n=1 Tax=Serratia phage Kevin TaxID=3161161 RepID=A0AAU8KXE8_9CAUD
MAHVRIQKVNDVRMRVICDDEGFHADLYEYFKFPDPAFEPSSFSRWDGMVRFYQKGSGLINIGLFFQLFQFIRDNGHTLEVDPALRYVQDITMEEIKEFLMELNMSIRTENGTYTHAESREYQFDCIETAIRQTRCCLQAATSAGKSMVLYVMARYYRGRREALQSSLKTLIVVPSVHLVTQLFDNFVEYSHFNGFNSEANVHLIYGGAEKDTTKPIVISTWQGIQDQPKEWFRQFGDIVVDEAHTAKAEKLTYIMDSCINCDHRLGLTGTLANNELNAMKVLSHFGAFKKIITARELIEQGFAADIEVMMVELQYGMEDRHKVTADYAQEIEFIISHEGRNRCLLMMAKTLKGNTAIMFDRVDAHMKVIYEELCKIKDNVYMINGEVPPKVRAQIQKAVEAGDEVTLLGTYGTMQQGVSIKKLHNLVLAHPSKSYIRVIQTLGRLMRMHSSKTKAKIFDLVDNLSLRGRPNHALRHSIERHRFYVEERHPVAMKKVQL